MPFAFQPMDIGKVGYMRLTTGDFRQLFPFRDPFFHLLCYIVLHKGMGPQRCSKVAFALCSHLHAGACKSSGDCVLKAFLDYQPYFAAI